MACRRQSCDLEFGNSRWNKTDKNKGAVSNVFQVRNLEIKKAHVGFRAGSLQALSVDVDGVITGQYSNGQVTAFDCGTRKRLIPSFSISHTIRPATLF